MAHFLRLAQVFSSNETPSSRGSQFAFSVAVISSDQINLVKGKVHWSCSSQSITATSRDRSPRQEPSWRQELKWRLLRNTAYCLAPHGLPNLLSLFSHTTQDCLPRSGLGPLISIINKVNDCTDIPTGQTEGCNPQLRLLLHR